MCQVQYTLFETNGQKRTSLITTHTLTLTLAQPRRMPGYNNHSNHLRCDTIRKEVYSLVFFLVPPMILVSTNDSSTSTFAETIMTTLFQLVVLLQTEIPVDLTLLCIQASVLFFSL